MVKKASRGRWCSIRQLIILMVLVSSCFFLYIQVKKRYAEAPSLDSAANDASIGTNFALPESHSSQSGSLQGASNEGESPGSPESESGTSGNDGEDIIDASVLGGSGKKAKGKADIVEEGGEGKDEKEEVEEEDETKEAEKEADEEKQVEEKEEQEKEEENKTEEEEEEEGEGRIEENLSDNNVKKNDRQEEEEGVDDDKEEEREEEEGEQKDEQKEEEENEKNAEEVRKTLLQQRQQKLNNLQAPSYKTQSPSPKAQSTNPTPQKAIPEPQNASPRPETQTPRPQNANPRPENENPKAQVIIPIPQNASPKPQNPIPKPQIVSPKPQNENPKSQTTSTRPQAAKPAARRPVLHQESKEAAALRRHRASLRQFLDMSPPENDVVFNSTGSAKEEIQNYRENKWVNIPFSLEHIMPEPLLINVSDPNAADVFVNMHIPRTGGTTFMAKLTKFANVDPPCLCRHKKGVKKSMDMDCECVNQQGMVWNFNRFVVGNPCGVNADFTELSACVPRWYAKKFGAGMTKHLKYHYLTILRDPVDRFLSEWKHTQRGGEFRYKHVCDEEIYPYKMCFDPQEDNSQLSLQDFLSCRNNIAFNRQTRMLADLSVVNCYDLKDDSLPPTLRDEIMLESAKRNLVNNFHFYAILEFLEDSSKLFNTRFTFFTFQDQDVGESQRDYSKFKKSYPDLVEEIIKKNELDVRLYQFARSLLFARFTAVGLPIPAQIVIE